MTKANLSYLFNGTVHADTVEGHRISTTTHPDGRAVVVVYDEQGLRTKVLMYRFFERFEFIYEQSEVDPVSNDHPAGSDPEVRKTVSLAAGQAGS